MKDKRVTSLVNKLRINSLYFSPCQCLIQSTFTLQIVAMLEISLLLRFSSGFANCKLSGQKRCLNVIACWLNSSYAKLHSLLLAIRVTAKLREAFLFQVPNSFGIFLITFAILKNPFANPLKKVANLLMEFAMFLS